MGSEKDIADDTDGTFGGTFDLDLTHFNDDQMAGVDAQPLLVDDSDDEWDSGWGDDLEVPGHLGQENLEDIYSETSLWKARQLIESDSIHWLDDERTKANVEGSTLYFVRVQPLDGITVPWLQCNCPNGTHRTMRPGCYHSAAVAMVHMGVDYTQYSKPAQVSRK